MKNVIEISDLAKRYDDNFALENINLKIPSGRIIGLIGENGAGKTTIIKLLLNIIKKDKGSIKIFEKDSSSFEEIIKEDIGIVLDEMFFPEVLTPNDINLIMKDIYKSWDQNKYFEYLKSFQIPLKQKIKNCSKGMRKKLELATALAHNPKLLILDEATSGLDPVVRSEVLDIFQKFICDEEHTILFSTHITSDLEHIADEIIFLDKGSVLINESRDTIMDDYAILKCDLDYFANIAKEDMIAYKKNKYEYQILIKDKKKISKKYKECIVDKITLEELMVLMIKGEKVCLA